MNKIVCFSFVIFLKGLIFASFSAIPLDMPEYKWMDEAISENFSYCLENKITIEKLEKTWSEVKADTDNFRRYQIINSEIIGPKGVIYNFLSTLVKLYSVPDIDFIYCSADSYGRTHDAPILIASMSRGIPNLILFTDRMFEITRPDLSWNLWIREINNSYSKWPWKEKIEKAYWRGTPSDSVYSTETWTRFPRGKLVYLSHFIAPDDVDATFCLSAGALGCIRDGDRFLQSVPIVSFPPMSDVTQYKYHVNIDGATCVYPTFQWKLLSGGLTFKIHRDEQIQWFYPGLKPSVHYISVQGDLSDLIEKIQWAKTHDEESKQIAENARHFALNNLMPEHILYYCYKVLLKYASMQDFSPEPCFEHQDSYNPYSMRWSGDVGQD